MEKNPKILCIGSMLWDVIGRSSIAMQVGSDVPGHITRLPGGVAMNIAMTLRNFGLRPALLSVIGQDRAGKDLIKLAKDFDLTLVTCIALTTCPPTNIWQSKEVME